MKLLVTLLLIFTASISFAQKNSFFISSSVGIGPGKTEFSFDVDEQVPDNALSAVTRREFVADLFQSNLNLSLGYSFKGIGFGVTTYLSTQKDSDAASTIFRGSGTSNTVRGDENYPNGKRYYGMFLHYDLKLNATISFSPRIDLLRYRYSNKGTLVESPTFVDNSFNYNGLFINKSTIGFSPRFKFSVAENQSFLFGAMLLYDSFKLSEEYLLETISNYRSSQTSFSITIGYEFAF